MAAEPDSTGRSVVTWIAPAVVALHAVLWQPALAVLLIGMGLVALRAPGPQAGRVASPVLLAPLIALLCPPTALIAVKVTLGIAYIGGTVARLTTWARNSPPPPATTLAFHGLLDTVAGAVYVALALGRL